MKAKKMLRNREKLNTTRSWGKKKKDTFLTSLSNQVNKNLKKKSLYNYMIATVKIQYLLPLTTSLITNVCLITLAKIKKAIILVT